jgi:Holliday junction resolvase-like predicted endonuclease
MTDDELKALVASLAVSQAKTDDEIKALVANTAISQAKTDAQLAKTDAQLAKTDAQLAKTDRKLKKIGEMVGTFGRNLGEITEEFFFNSLKATQRLGGIHYDSIDKNVTRSSGKLEDEFDIVMINGQDVAIIEVKYKAHEADLKKLVTKKQANFKTLFPIYKDYRHHLVLATFSIYDELKEDALSKGVTVLQRKGDVIETFEPKVA